MVGGLTWSPPDHIWSSALGMFARDSQLSRYDCPAMSIELVIDMSELNSVDRGILAVVSIMTLRGIVLIPFLCAELIVISLLHS
jgi:hypothetical protein